MKLISKVYRLSMDLRFLVGDDRYSKFDKDLRNLLNKHNIAIRKETCNEVTSNYEGDIVVEKCPHCGEEVRAYVTRASFCMNCGKIIYPCSLCTTCTNDCIHNGGM